MKICHFSDCHGDLPELPSADLYVCTGDVLTNFPLQRWQTDRWDRRSIITVDPLDPPDLKDPAWYLGRIIDKEREARFQPWLIEGGWHRRMLGNPEAPVIVVRGNHDFIDLKDLWGEPVWEIDDDPSRTFDFGGLKFGGMRGIMPVGGNEWNDEYQIEKWDDMSSKIPRDLDVLITHAPPQGVLDLLVREYSVENLGVGALRRYVNNRFYKTEQNDDPPLKLHLFGHIHEDNGLYRVDSCPTLFSNAATTHHMLEVT